jgi:hypothetical protein
MTRLCTTQRWCASADDEELFSDVDTGAADNTVAASGFAAALDGFWFAHDRSVAGEAVTYPERALFLAEFEVSFRHRFAGVGDHHKLVEFLVRLGHGVTSEQAVAVHRNALAGRELEHKASTGLTAGNDPCALDVVEVVGGAVRVERAGRCRARHNHVCGKRAIVACAEVNRRGRFGSELQVRFWRGPGRRLGLGRWLKLGLWLWLWLWLWRGRGLKLGLWRGLNCGRGIGLERSYGLGLGLNCGRGFEGKFWRAFRFGAGCGFGLSRGLGRRNRRCGLARKRRKICDRCKRRGH